MQFSFVLVLSAQLLSYTNAIDNGWETNHENVYFFNNRNDFMNALKAQNAVIRTTVACTPYEAQHGHLPFTQGDLTINSNEETLMQIKGSDANFGDVPVYEVDAGDVITDEGFFFENEYPFYAMGFDMNQWGGSRKFSLKVGDAMIGEYNLWDGHAGELASFYGWIATSPDMAVQEFQLGYDSYSNSNQVTFIDGHTTYGLAARTGHSDQSIMGIGDQLNNKKHLNDPFEIEWLDSNTITIKSVSAGLYVGLGPRSGEWGEKNPFLAVLVDGSDESHHLRVVDAINDNAGFKSFVAKAAPGEENYYLNHCNGKLYFSKEPQNNWNLFKKDASWKTKCTGLPSIKLRLTNFIYAIPEEEGAEENALGDDCDGYDPVEVKRVCKGTAWGDPHLVTFDGLKYDAQAKGEAIFLQQPSSSLQVHARLEEAFNNWNFNPKITTGLAIQGTEPNHPKIQVSMSSDPDAPKTLRGCPVELYVNDIVQSKVSHNSLATGGASVTMDVDCNLIKVSYPGLLLLEMSVHFFGACHFSVDVSLLDCDAASDVIGLLGSPNGHAGDDWMSRDGDPYPLPHGVSQFFFQGAYEYVSENWMIEDSTQSIFTTFDDSTDEEEYDPEFENFITADDETINPICGGDVACLIDGKIMGVDAARQSLKEPATRRTAVFDDTRATPIPRSNDDQLCVEEL